MCGGLTWPVILARFGQCVVTWFGPCFWPDLAHVFGLIWPFDFGLIWPLDFGLIWPLDFGLIWPLDFGLIWPLDFGLIWPLDFGLIWPMFFAWFRRSSWRGLANMFLECCFGNFFPCIAFCDIIFFWLSVVLSQMFDLLYLLFIVIRFFYQSPVQIWRFWDLFFFFLDILLSGIDMKRAICRTTHSVVWYQFSCICSYDRRHVGLAKMTKVGMPVIPTKSLRIALFIAYGNLCGEQYGCATNWSCALWYFKGAYNGRGGVVPPLVLIHSWSHLSKERKERKLVQSSPKSLSPPI